MVEWSATPLNNRTLQTPPLLSMILGQYKTQHSIIHLNTHTHTPHYSNQSLPSSSFIHSCWYYCRCQQECFVLLYYTIIIIKHHHHHHFNCSSLKCTLHTPSAHFDAPVPIRPRCKVRNVKRRTVRSITLRHFRHLTGHGSPLQLAFRLYILRIVTCPK